MKKILIVEDELMIAGNLERILKKHGYSVPVIAIDYGEALHALATIKFDLALLDINLSGTKGGIEIAEVINSKYQIPFLYLTSNTDKKTLELLKKTRPAGYLSKPIQSATLTTNIDLIFENTAPDISEVIIKIGNTAYRYLLADILYAQADHVYTELFHSKGSDVLRISLQALMDEFPEGELLRINRSVAVRRNAIDRVDKTHVYIADKDFKISRSLTDDIFEAM